MNATEHVEFHVEQCLMCRFAALSPNPYHNACAIGQRLMDLEAEQTNEQGE